jgi:hypothetical protein
MTQSTQTINKSEVNLIEKAKPTIIQIKKRIKN